MTGSPYDLVDWRFIVSDDGDDLHIIVNMHIFNIICWLGDSMLKGDLSPLI